MENGKGQSRKVGGGGSGYLACNDGVFAKTCQMRGGLGEIDFL